jgi:hypothetical protein
MGRHETDDVVSLDPAALDGVAEGEEFRGADYLVLAFLGLMLPVALLVWGWL